MSGDFWKKHGLGKVSDFFAPPQDKAAKLLNPVIAHLQEIADRSNGALVVETLSPNNSKNKPTAVTLKTPDAEAFPQSSEYIHTRDHDPAVESKSFTVATDIRGGDIFLVAISHDHSRMRTADPAHAQIDERQPDLEIPAGKTCPAALKEKAEAFVKRILPEQEAQKIYPPKQAATTTPTSKAKL